MSVRLQSESTWNGLKPGDKVKVRGKRGTWKFQSLGINPATNERWVNVYGGVREQCRAFSVDRVEAV